MKTITCGNVAPEALSEALDLLTDETHDVTVEELALGDLHLSDQAIQRLLGLDHVSFLRIKHHLQLHDATGIELLCVAAKRLAKGLHPVRGVVINLRDLRCDFDTVLKFFMDKEVRHIVKVAKRRTVYVLTQLGVQNPGLECAVIDDDGPARRMIIAEAVQVVQQPLPPHPLDS